MADGWLTLGVAVITAAAGLGGGVLTHRLSRGRAREETETARLQHLLDVKREAYVRFFQAFSNLETHLGGGSQLGHGAPNEALAEVARTAAVVELFAPTSVWTEVAPAVEMLALMGNSLPPFRNAGARAELAARGLDNPEVREQVKAGMLAALKRDIAMDPASPID